VSLPWWKESVVYQIYARSFDLKGVSSRLDYLLWLGVDALWLSPFLRAPTLDDFDRLVEAAHQRELKVLIDCAPMHDVLRFWLARGVDGFHVSSDHDSAHPRLRGLRTLLDSYPGNPVIVGDGKNDALHLVLSALPIDTPWHAEAFAERIRHTSEALEPNNAWPTWRLMRASIGEREARAAAVLTLTLRGTPFLCMGEELGLEDPAQQADVQSMLWLYRKLLAARRSSPALHRGSQRMLDVPQGVLAWERRAEAEAREVWINFEPLAIDIPARGEVVVASQGRDEGFEFSGRLEPHEAVVLIQK
jgi:alpha-glucosidase